MVTNAQSTAEIRSLNKKKIIEYLRMIKPATMKELADKLALSFATVSNLCNLLMDEGIIRRESSQLSKGGRIPGIMSVDPNCRYLLGMNVIGAEEGEALIINIFGETIASEKFSITSCLNFDSLIDLFYELSMKLLEASGINYSKLIGVGVAAPGIYSQSTELLINSTNPILESKPLKAEIEKRFNIPTYIENESNLMVLATSLKNYSSYSHPDILYIYIDEGLGTGILCNGHLVMGSHGLGGEISHMPLGCRNYLCYCGNTGCVETELSKDGFLRKYYDEISSIPPHINRVKGWQNFVNAAIQQETGALKVLEENGRLLGKLTSVLINLFDPEAVHIGGMINPIFHYMHPFIYEEAAKRQTVKGMSELRIIQSENYENLISKGCSELVINDWRP